MTGENIGAIATVLIASIATLLPSTTINVAIPDIQGALGLDDIRAQWLSSGFLAATTIGMLSNAWLIGRFGIRATLSSCLLLFMVGSMVGGLANSIEAVIISRILQGLAAGPVMPLSMLVMFSTFPPQNRGLAMGLFGMGVVLAPAFGPALGGWLIDQVSWRFVFFGMAPLALLALPLGLMFLPSEREARHQHYDWIGMLLMATCVLTTMAFMSRGPRETWNDDITLALIGAAPLLLLLFVYWEWRSESPLMEVRLFRRIPFAMGALASLISGLALYATTYLLPLFVQTIQHLTPMQSGTPVYPGRHRHVTGIPDSRIHGRPLAHP